MSKVTKSGDVSLEDINWRSPAHVAQMGGRLHSNNVLYYFAESPFFDPTSNNASLVAQAMRNPNMQHVMETREALENTLKMMAGLEFVVARDPLAEHAAACEAAAKATPSGQLQPQDIPEVSDIWVIRKQVRRKSHGRPDSVEILATYFIVDETIFMAPSVFRVVGNRMLSTVTSLTKAFSATSSLPLFSASHGHTYTPTVSKTLEAARLARSTNQSKSTTPIPGVTEETREFSETMTPAQSAAMLQNALNLAKGEQLMRQYGNEYIDEIPLLGEPGSFLFAARKPETQPSARQTAVPNRFTTTSSVPASAAGTKPGTPSAKMADKSVASANTNERSRK
ncbi:mediator of RNA polymerase II transcription subunit 6 [Ascosphaera apis ARSEF 7405]|uniref:Mediator of RNA polymerase II transcription subunit 6 n=1 Tax=Ascosphaera apis ARSEF 7405 TaxID=392613 RepID=A0A167X2V6_9EURO|nr:mediator of RNA polymerase II transcription subunit 6 [Ascosphaera apis ARSEF 7405]